MALRLSFIDNHIAHWQARLTSPVYPHRKHWPARLFHHAPLENAIMILTEGVLRSRNDVANHRARDVAAPGVIDARVHAHDRVRLYFRPKTPTQYHIEGIRKAGECNYGDATHCPVLIMFGLDARTVLSQPDVMFSNQNMQLGDTVAGDDEAYFSQIDFDKVYHEGPTGRDRSITACRAAEVLPSSPLELSQSLREIYVRSEPERDTLLHLLGKHRREWEGFCRVSDALKVFQKDYAFVQEIPLTPKGVRFVFNPRADRKDLDVIIEVWDRKGNKVVDFYNDGIAAKPPGASTWIFENPLKAGTYLVRVKVEGNLAYEATIPLESVII